MPFLSLSAPTIPFCKTTKNKACDFWDCIMEAIIDLAKHLANTTDEAGRKRLSDGFRNLSYSLETPDDTLQRIIYYVNACTTQPSLRC